VWGVGAVLRWFDKNLWSTPVAVLIVTELIVTPLQVLRSRGVLVESISKDARENLYSSLSGSSSGLLGFALAAVAILAVFSPRKTANRTARIREEDLATARVQVIGTLLATSFMLLVVLVVSSLGIALDSKGEANPVIANLAFCCSCASVVGLFLGGLGMGLSVLEKNRADREPVSQ
jgi:hypothetical protein